MWKYLLTLFILYACSSQNPVEEKEALKKEETLNDLNEEIRIGKDISAKLAGKYGIYKNTAILKYINLIGKNIASKGPRPEIEYYFSILDTDDVNAFAAPGGFVFVTKGALKKVKNEAELAGILGHEIAHITHFHLYDQIKQPKKKIDAKESLVRMIGRGGSAFEIAIGLVVNKGMEILLKDGLSQDKEAEADQSGVELSIAAGYKGKALSNFLKRLESENLGLLAKTHPPLQKRVSDIQSFLSKNGLSGEEGQDLEPRFTQSCTKKMI